MKNNTTVRTNLFILISLCLFNRGFNYHLSLRSNDYYHTFSVFFFISGKPIDIMKPRAVAACNDGIARDVVKLIREADQRVDMREK